MFFYCLRNCGIPNPNTLSFVRFNFIQAGFFSPKVFDIKSITLVDFEHATFFERYEDVPHGLSVDYELKRKD